MTVSQIAPESSTLTRKISQDSKRWGTQVWALLRLSRVAIVKLASMALISLHALIRHQNQRSRKTAPAPATSCSRKRKSATMLVLK